MAYYIYHKPTHIQPRPLTDPHSELLTTLNEILQRYPPFPSHRYESHGLYYGPTSVAYLFLRLSEIFPSLSLGGKSCKEWCAEYLRIPPRKGITADRCGIGSELMAHMAVEACLKLDEGLVFAGVCSPDVTYIILDEEEAGSDEWLYGRAGYLYYLRMIRHFFPRNNARVHGVVENTIERTIQRIMKSPQPWRWHGNEYLGAVHGTIGIITQIILSNSDRLPALKPLLNRLLDQQLDNGNWPSSVGSHHPDRLVQLCHGAPGLWFPSSPFSLKSGALTYSPQGFRTQLT